MDWHLCLAIGMDRLHEHVQFLNVLMILTLGFAHGEASAADAHAVDFDIRSGGALQTIIRVWVADIHRAIVRGVRVHVLALDSIEPFWCLLVISVALWPQ